MNPLFAVRERLRARGSATSRQLAAELELPTAVVEDILAHFERRGQVQAVTPAAVSGCGADRCGSCNLCFTAGPSVAWFRWRGAGDAARTAPTAQAQAPGSQRG